MDPDRWLGVELRHFAALEAVAQTASFGRAAARLGYTQSAVSQQIQMLERIVGQKLVERPGGPKAVSLTEAGEVLLRHSHAIMARLAAAQADIAALAAGTFGTLRVGTFQSVGSRILPHVIRRFYAELPDVRVQLVETPNDEDLLDLVERGELDLAFTMLPVDAGPFETLQVLADPYVLVVEAASPLGRSGRLTVRDLEGLQLIAFRQCRSQLALEGALQAHGIQPDVVFRSDDNGTVQGLASAGHGCALVPLLTVDTTDESVRVIDMASQLPPRLIGVAWHRDRYRSAAARAFVDIARDLCAELQRSTLTAA